MHAVGGRRLSPGVDPVGVGPEAVVKPEPPVGQPGAVLTVGVLVFVDGRELHAIVSAQRISCGDRKRGFRVQDCLPAR